MFKLSDSIINSYIWNSLWNDCNFIVWNSYNVCIHIFRDCHMQKEETIIQNNINVDTLCISKKPITTTMLCVWITHIWRDPGVSWRLLTILFKRRFFKHREPDNEYIKFNPRQYKASPWKYRNCKNKWGFANWAIPNWIFFHKIFTVTWDNIRYKDNKWYFWVL